MILPFNATVLEREEEDNGEVIEPERPPGQMARWFMSSDGQGKGVGRMEGLSPLALLNRQEGIT